MMIKQITKTKKIFNGVILLLFFSLLFTGFTGNVKALSGGPASCALTGKSDTAGSACYDLATVCQDSSLSSSATTLCGDIGTACAYQTSSIQQTACSSTALIASCGIYPATLGNVCSDLSTYCATSVSTKPICSGYTSACSGSSPTNIVCPNNSNPSGAVADTCYDSYTGWTYLCGAGAIPGSNEYSAAPVLDSSLKLDPQVVVASGTNNISEYKFSSSTSTPNCYAVQLTSVPTSNGKSITELAWVEQPATECNSNTAFSPATANSDGNLPLPDLVTGSSTGSPIDCQSNSSSNCIVSKYINPLIRFLNIAVSLVVVISIVIGGIQYSASRDNPEAVKAARRRIMNAIIGLVSYFLLWSLLNFIIPGGI